MADDSARIVVGVDGSAASKEALRWAARQAALTRANLDVVIAWRPPVTYGYAVETSDADFEGRARETIDSLVSEVLGSDVPTSVRTSVTEGHPAPVLIEAARGGPARGRQPWPWGVQRNAVGLHEHALRAPRDLPCARGATLHTVLRPSAGGPQAAKYRSPT